ncbi:MAG: cobalamin biosynthesis protein [Thermodesulfobacteriota bacterium]
MEQWIGIASVCEAAAILAAGQGSLVVPKQARGNVTVALARRPRPFIWSEPAREAWSIFPGGPWRSWSRPRS